MSRAESHKFSAHACHSCLTPPHERHRGVDRRRLLGLLGLGAVGAIAGTSLLGARAFAAPGTEALLLTCIDYRLTAATTRYMTDRQMEGKYDQFILAGAALG